MNFNELTKAIHADNVKAGWWSKEDQATLRGENGEKARVVLIASKLCLVHSEISEALEGLRKGLKDDHLPTKKMYDVEIADTFIRLLDLAGATIEDLDGCINEKMAYNQTRADHKKENRDSVGGKTI